MPLPAEQKPVPSPEHLQGGAGYTGPPLIELNGALAGAQAVGLTLTGGSSVVRGLVVNGFAIGGSAGGIRLRTGGDNWIHGNYIGVTFAGDTRVANTRGIWIDNGSSNNRIGTNADGVNDPNRKPEPRYGDSGVGEPANKQMVVSDHK